MTFVDTRLDAVTSEVRDSIAVSSMPAEVHHWSIPALDEFGSPVVEAADAIGSAKLRLTGGEVMISRLNPRKARVVAVPANLHGFNVASGEFVVLRPVSICQQFLYYLLSSTAVRQRLDAHVQSVTRSQQRVRPEQVRQLRVRIPSNHGEQQRIADFLDAETSRIDGLIETHAAAIRLLGERERSALDLSLGAAQIDWSDHGTPIGLGKPMVRLAAVAFVQSGVTLDSGRSLDDAATEVPYLRVANVQDGHVDLEEIKTVPANTVMMARHSLRPGDVLMTEGGDPDKLGRGAVWQGQVDPCLHQNHVFAVRPDPARLDPEFLSLLTRTTYARAYFETTATKTTGIASTSATKIAGFRIPVLTLDAQRAAVARTQAELRLIAELTELHRQQIALLRERRQALITAAVTGELEVP